MKSAYIIGIILVALAVGGYLFIQNNPQPTATPVTSRPSASPTPESELGQGGSSYLDPQGVYNFLYPADYKLETQNEGQHIRIYKTGPTQKGQTEMYDGVIIVFETIDLKGQNLEQWVDQYITDSTKDGTQTVTEPKKVTTLNNNPALSFKMRGLGESEYLVAQKDASSPNAVMITSAVHDPQNIGFQSEVDQIFSTIKLLK